MAIFHLHALRHYHRHEIKMHSRLIQNLRFSKAPSLSNVLPALADVAALADASWPTAYIGFQS